MWSGRCGPAWIWSRRWATGGRGGGAGLVARAGVGGLGEGAVNLAPAGQGMVAGDAVNTASRVQAAAEPGTVLVDGVTRRLAGGAVGFAMPGSTR